MRRSRIPIHPARRSPRSSMIWTSRHPRRRRLSGPAAASPTPPSSPPFLGESDPEPFPRATQLLPETSRPPRSAPARPRGARRRRGGIRHARSGDDAVVFNARMRLRVGLMPPARASGRRRTISQVGNVDDVVITKAATASPMRPAPARPGAPSPARKWETTKATTTAALRGPRQCRTQRLGQPKLRSSIHSSARKTWN